jgi:hypothetical protein
VSAAAGVSPVIDIRHVHVVVVLVDAVADPVLAAARPSQVFERGDCERDARKPSLMAASTGHGSAIAEAGSCRHNRSVAVAGTGRQV